jgi:hypothetical protein
MEGSGKRGSGKVRARPGGRQGPASIFRGTPLHEKGEVVKVGGGWGRLARWARLARLARLARSVEVVRTNLHSLANLDNLYQRI